MRQSRVGAAVLLGAAALLLVPAAASAQVRFGGGRFGGGYYGGYSPGMYNYGYAPGFYGNYGYSSYGGGYYPGYSTYGSGYYPGSVWGNYNRGSYYGNGSTYPGYGATDFYSSGSAGMSSYYGPGTMPDAGYSYGARAGAETRDSVRLNVRLPDPNAEVWVEGKRTEQRGTSREFVSPALNPDKSYTYEVRARWTENGKDVERTKTVPVRANGTVTVDFTSSAGNSRVDEIDKDRPAPGSGKKSPDKDRSDKE
jgi:uncharacterized protein (TIGR03000 family)